ncbi:hypothetical protein DLREEDagrD3_12420 [Denitratisoma sp. agr-D3]
MKLTPLLLTSALALPAAAHAADWDGYSWGWQLGAIQQDTASRITADHIGAGAPYYLDATDAAVTDRINSATLSKGNGAGGLKAGYSKSYGNVVAGFDVRLDTGFDQSRSASGVTNGTMRFNQKVSSDWTLSLLPRLGWAWENKLIYATAGVAASQVSLATDYADSNNGRASHKTTKTLTGLVLGFGGEYALDKATSISFHYAYSDFGKVHNDTFILSPFGTGNNSTLKSTADVRTHTLMVGYTYRFGN